MLLNVTALMHLYIQFTEVEQNNMMKELLAD